MLAVAAAHAQSFRWTTHEEIAVGILAAVILGFLYLIFKSDPVSPSPDEERDYLLSQIDEYSERCRDICEWLASDTPMHRQAIKDALKELHAQQESSGS